MASLSGTPIRPAQLRNIRVLTYLGSIAETEIPRGESSTSIALQAADSAPFDAQYATPPAQPSLADTLDTATTFMPSGE